MIQCSRVNNDKFYYYSAKPWTRPVNNHRLILQSQSCVCFILSVLYHPTNILSPSFIPSPRHHQSSDFIFTNIGECPVHVDGIPIQPHVSFGLIHRHHMHTIYTHSSYWKSSICQIICQPVLGRTRAQISQIKQYIAGENIPLCVSHSIRHECRQYWHHVECR